VLDQVFSSLQKADLNLEQLFTPREIAEILWFAVQLDKSSNQDTPASESAKQTNQQSSSQSQSLNTSEAKNQNDSNKNQFSQADTDIDNEQSNQESNIPINLPPRNQEKSPSSPKPNLKEQNSPSELSLKVPLATSLSKSLLLGRALRPLKIKVPSQIEQNLDEKATAYRIAEERIRIAVVRPKPERWLDLEIVVEQTPSTYIWQLTIDEWHNKLKYHGAFRNVRMWGLKKKEDSFELFGHQGKGKYSNTPHSLKELIDYRGRRLILSKSVEVSFDNSSSSHSSSISSDFTFFKSELLLIR